MVKIQFPGLIFFGHFWVKVGVIPNMILLDVFSTEDNSTKVHSAR